MGPSSPISFSRDQGQSHLPVSDWTVQSRFELEIKFFAELVLWLLALILTFLLLYRTPRFGKTAYALSPSLLIGFNYCFYIWLWILQAGQKIIVLLLSSSELCWI